MTLAEKLQAQIDDAWRDRVIVPCPSCGSAAARDAKTRDIVCGWCRSRNTLRREGNVRVWLRSTLEQPGAEHAPA